MINKTQTEEKPAKSYKIKRCYLVSPEHPEFFAISAFYLKMKYEHPKTEAPKVLRYPSDESFSKEIRGKDLISIIVGTDAYVLGYNPSPKIPEGINLVRATFYPSDGQAPFFQVTEEQRNCHREKPTSILPEKIKRNFHRWLVDWLGYKSEGEQAK